MPPLVLEPTPSALQISSVSGMPEQLSSAGSCLMEALKPQLAVLDLQAYSPTGDMGYEASIGWDIRWGAMSRPGSRYATCREQQQQDGLATQQGPLSLDVQDRQRQARKQQQQADEEYDSVELVSHELEQPENDGVGQANIKGSHKLELLSIPTHADGCSPTGFQSAHSSTRRSAQLNCSGSDLASIDLPRSDSRRAVAFPSRQTTGSSSNRSAAVYRSETGDCSSAEQRTLATDSTQPPVHGGHHYKPSCQRKGFSILGKDTRQQQVVSPGPAAYEVHEGLTVRNAGAAKLVGRPSDRLFISKLHEESQVSIQCATHSAAQSMTWCAVVGGLQREARLGAG